MSQEYIEITEKTVDDAITTACQRLSVTSNRLDYIVVQREKSGFLGIGAKPAIIKARVKDAADATQAILDDVIGKAEKKIQKELNAKSSEKKESKPFSPAAKEEKKAPKKVEKEVKAEKKEDEKAEKKELKEKDKEGKKNNKKNKKKSSAPKKAEAEGPRQRLRPQLLLLKRRLLLLPKRKRSSPSLRMRRSLRSKRQHTISLLASSRPWIWMWRSTRSIRKRPVFSPSIWKARIWAF